MQRTTGSDRGLPDDGASGAGEAPRFRPGDQVRIAGRTVFGNDRVPLHLRGLTATVEGIVGEVGADAEDAGFAPAVASGRHCYRIVVPMPPSWPDDERAVRLTVRIRLREACLEWV